MNTPRNDQSLSNAAAREIAVKAISGSMPEDEARLAIAGIIEAANVPTEVAAEQRGLSDRTRRDLASLLSDMMVGRVTGSGGFRKDLELERIAKGESVTGWGRQLLRMGAPSKLRDLMLIDSRDLLVAPTTPDSEETFDGITAAFHNAGTLSAEDTIDETRFNDSLISLQDLSGLRHTAQTKQDARHLRAAYQITAPIVVPEDAADRQWVIDTLESDPMSAYASLIAWQNIHKPTTIDDRLLFLWDDFTSDEGAELASHRPAFAHKLALAAALLLPKPSRDTLRSAVKITILAAPGQEWAENAEALINSWVAVECAPVSEFKTKSRGDEEQVAAEREIDSAAWPVLVKRTSSWHNAPLGRTEDSITDFIKRSFSGIDPDNFPLG